MDYLKKLEANEDFQKWRDEVVLPELDNIEAMKLNALALTEADLKATILYELKIKALFRNIFDQNRAVEELEKDK